MSTIRVSGTAEKALVSKPLVARSARNGRSGFGHRSVEVLPADFATVELFDRNAVDWLQG
jgi:hypothetical protein